MTPEQHEILTRIDEKVGHLVEGQADQEARIRSLEKFKNWATGAVAFISSAMGLSIHNLK